MKLLIALCLSFASTLAFGQTLSMPNRGGGEIVLTTEGPCVLFGTRFTDARIAFSYGPKRQALRGCWSLLDGAVYILWDNGYLMQYDPTAFKQKEGI